MAEYFAVRVGKSGDSENFAELARNNGYVAIGWHQLGDLSWLIDEPDDARARQRLAERYAEVLEVSGPRLNMGVALVWMFVREMKEGDVVVMPRTSAGLVHIGRVSGPATFLASPDDGCPHRRRRTVRWLADLKRDELPAALLRSLGARTTLFHLDHHGAAIEQLIADGVDITPHVDVVGHVLDRLLAMHPKRFEEFVASYFAAIGYTASTTPYVGDGGVDVQGELDAEGLARVMLRIQVKRTKSNVGIDTVLKTRGALAVDEQGAIIALGGFTSQASAEAEADGKKTITLVGGRQFVELVLSHWGDLDPEVQAQLGVQPREEVPIRDRFVVSTTRDE